ncbi:hypothetical protein Tco_0056882, partial [Tanacetum coccineum]
TEGDAINFNENQSFPDDEFLEPRSKVTQCPGNIKYFPYIPAYENISPTDSPTLQDSVSPEEPPVFTSADDLPVFNEHDHFDSVENLKLAEIQDILNTFPTYLHMKTSLPVIHLLFKTLSLLKNHLCSPVLMISQSSMNMIIWSREKHIELVNIIGEPLAGITTRSRVRDSDAASAHECLYVNFLSEIEPKKLCWDLRFDDYKTTYA